MRETKFLRPGTRQVGLVLLAAVALAFVSVVLVAQRPAEAHDHLVPNTVLKKGARDLQVGRHVEESSWNRPSGENECVNVSTIYTYELPDGTFNYPQVDRVAAGSELRVRIFKTQRPDSFFVRAFPEINERGEPSGEERLLNRTLVRIVRDGRPVAWDAVFSVNRPGRDYYLITEGHWKDTQGCRGDQFAFWSFHVQTGSAT